MNIFGIFSRRLRPVPAPSNPGILPPTPEDMYETWEAEQDIATEQRVRAIVREELAKHFAAPTA